MDQKSCGAFICKLREAANLTQEQVAEKMNVSVTAVQKWEEGSSFPDEANIAPLCELLNTSEKELRDAKPALTTEEMREQARIANRASVKWGLIIEVIGILMLVIRYMVLDVSNLIVNAFGGILTGMGIGLMVLGFIWLFSGLAGRAQG